MPSKLQRWVNWQMEDSDQNYCRMICDRQFGLLSGNGAWEALKKNIEVQNIL
jgi:hypothetical protein